MFASIGTARLLPVAQPEMGGVSPARLRASYDWRMQSALPLLARAPTPSSANTLYRLVVEVSNGRDLNVLDSLVASSVHDHTPLPDPE
jgi:hypothetical protein